MSDTGGVTEGATTKDCDDPLFIRIYSSPTFEDFLRSNLQKNPIDIRYTYYNNKMFGTYKRRDGSTGTSSPWMWRGTRPSLTKISCRVSWQFRAVRRRRKERDRGSLPVMPERQLTGIRTTFRIAAAMRNTTEEQKWMEYVGIDFQIQSCSSRII